MNQPILKDQAVQEEILFGLLDCCPKMSVTANLCCVMPQNNNDPQKYFLYRNVSEA
jgi:hypothetical protein